MSLFTLFLFNFHSLVGTFFQPDGFHHSDCDLESFRPKLVHRCLCILRIRHSFLAYQWPFQHCVTSRDTVTCLGGI